MSASGPRAAVEINLDEFERRLRAAGTQPAGLEDPLAELARLVESSRSAPARPAPSARVVSGPGRGQEEPAKSLEVAPLRPSIDAAPDEGTETAEVEPSPLEDAEQFVGHDPMPAAERARRASISWRLKASALALAGAAMIGAVFLLRGGVPGLPKAPPFIAAAQGPTKVQPPSDETVAASSDPGASLMKDSAPPTHVRIVNSEEQPVDLNAQAAHANAPSPAASAPSSTGSTQLAAAGASNGTPVAATVNTPVVAAQAAAPPPLALQFPDPKPVRTVSLRPDGTPIPTPAASADSTAAPPPVDAPKPPAKPASKATNDVAGVAQASTPRLDLPTKLAGKSSARVVVAKTDTTAPGTAAETPSQSVQPGASAKPEKPAKPSKSVQAAAEPTVAPAAPTAPAAPSQQPDNPLLHAFSSLVGAPAAPATPAQQPVDPTTATTSGGWAVQLAAPKSETEAQSDLARLNAKYASALNGSTIGVHKALVNGETVYRLRVVGLTKADAAALCARVKGDGGNCFIAK